MAKPRPLSKAPVLEALFDIRAVLPPSFKIESLADLAKRFRDTYPNVTALHRFEAQFAVTEGKPEIRPTPVDTVAGYLCKSSDERTIVQFRGDGFTLNRLAPYTSWDALIPEALRLWTAYAEYCHPESVPRVAVRYINKIVLPDFKSLAERLAWVPNLPPEVPGTLATSLIRVETHEDETRITSIVTQSIEKGLTSTFSALLDTDVFQQAEFVERLEEIPEVLASLRQVKNRVFFSCLTDMGVASYE